MQDIVTDSSSKNYSAARLSYYMNSNWFAVRSAGSFSDLVGVGLRPPPTAPITQAEAANVLNRVAQGPTDRNTIQTLTFYAPEGYILGRAIVHRHLTNLDADGKVKPTTNNSGRPVDNYSITVRLLTILPPEK